MVRPQRLLSLWKHHTFAILTSQPQFCPFKGCPSHHRSPQAPGWNDNGKTLATHLRDLHSSELDQLPDSLLDSLNLEVCRRCESTVYTDHAGGLSKHIKAKHVSTRTKTNHSIVTDHLFANKLTSETNQWESGLKWLLHTFKAEPPPFRQSLLLHIDWKLLDDIIDTFRDLISATVEATKPPSNEKDEHDKLRYDAKPLWLLCIIFEQLVLAPRPKDLSEAEKKKETITQCIYRRVRWFRAGRIQDLYNESRKVNSLPPSANAKAVTNDPTRIEKSAQLAANNDNYGTCADRLTKETPVATINDTNLPVLVDLHPKCKYKYRARKRSSLRTSAKKKRQRFRNSQEIVFTPSNIIDNIIHLKRGKGAGLQVDSLDLFIHVAKKCRTSSNKQKVTPFATTLANFFTLVANGDYPDSIKCIFRTTYLVALQKDPDDLRKLRPLGIPAAIRRITANAIANELKSDFAAYLLPYNYAVGIHGGIDFVSNTIRLGVEKYIKNPEEYGLLPSRALVSLDIRNMFNAISRHKLREIVRDEFPRLEPFVNSLYEEDGTTCVKLDDGDWEKITVSDGFSQGCPLSPILAAVVLNYILKRVNKKLQSLAQQRNNGTSDDGKGGAPIILAYVDDANFLVPYEDVLPLMEEFKLVGEELGAVMNTEKTRILTSTSGKSILEELEKQDEATFKSLDAAISTYSRQKVGDTTEKCEVTDGLRILGVPIGNDKFCQNFYQERVKAAASAAAKVLSGLSDKQTMLRVFKTSTLHKVTHLFAADVASTLPHNLPADWTFWKSGMSNSFSKVLNDFLVELLQIPSLPPHAHAIATISLSNGGLGLQHPRLAAIPTFMLSIKRAIDFASNGIFLPRTASAIPLPPSITCLYHNWQDASSTSRIFTTFNKYLPDIVSTVILDDPTCEIDPSQKEINKFISKTSIPWARESLRHHASQAFISHLVETAPDDVYHALPGLLQHHMSLPLIAMSRSDKANRLDNESFIIALKAKLRVGIYQQASCPMCFCKKLVDVHGDHYFTCGDYKKTNCSNSFRDTTAKVMERICPTAQYCRSKDDIEKEQRGKVKEAASKRPFDWSFYINSLTSSNLKRGSHLSEIGFDVTIIGPSVPINRHANANPQNNSNSLLMVGERDKFLRKRASSCPKSGLTLSGDQFIGKLYHSNRGFIPQAMDRWGAWGPLFERFMLGDRDAPAIMTYDHDITPNAVLMNERACSLNVPYGILNTANKRWMDAHPETWFGNSYMDSSPKIWALGQLGLGFTKALVAHIKSADKKIHNPSAESCYQQRRRNRRSCVVPLINENGSVESPSSQNNNNSLLNTAGNAYVCQVIPVDGSTQHENSDTQPSLSS